jgi:hypothetical protein
MEPLPMNKVIVLVVAGVVWLGATALMLAFFGVHHP